MKIIRSLLPVLTILLLASCMDDFLDVKPVGKLIPTRASEYENLLFNENTVQIQFMDNNRGSVPAYLADNLYMSDGVDDMYTPSYVNIERYAAYVFYSPVTDPYMPQYQWTVLYRVVCAHFNTLIEGIGGLDASESDTNYARSLIAAAKAGRIWAYMNAAFFWGPGFDPGGANDTPVIPYRTSSSPLIPNPPRHTTSEIFELLKTDLDDAVAHIPTTVANPSRANLAAVYALYAQYYMYRHEWTEMLDYADKAWTAALANVGGDADKLIYNYNELRYIAGQVPPLEGEDEEVNFNLGYYPGGTYDASEPLRLPTNREVLLYREACWENPSVLPSEEFVALFDPDTDMRYKLFMLNANTTGNVIAKRYFRNSKFDTGSTQGLSYPEVLLLRAEARARTNNLTGSLADLNTLRGYRYETGTGDLENGASLNQDQLLEEILRERRRELPLVSHHRLYDLKRFQFETGKPWCKTVIEHKIGESQTFSKSISDPVFNAPITNPIITMNPAWGLELATDNYRPKQ